MGNMCVRVHLRRTQKKRTLSLGTEPSGGGQFTAIEALGTPKGEVSLAYQSHPEFEYFRPLRNFLRKAGIAFALISFAVIGVALVLRAGHISIADMTLMAARTHEIPSSAQPTSADPTMAITTAKGFRSRETSTASCEQDMWAYLDGKCMSGRARKVRSPRAATDGSFGRNALPMPATSQLPPKSGSAVATSAPAAVQSTAQSNPALKKARKTAISQTNGDDAGNKKKARKTAISQTSGDHVGKSNSSVREERVRDERWSARASAISDGRNPPGMYERSWGWSR
jgi:hypothetical protein